MQRVLVSVTVKDKLEEFKRLYETGNYEFISTGGTHTALERLGIKCTLIEEVTSFPEMMDGRLKTLHPMVFGGILADRNKSEHMKALALHEMVPVDLVVVNLYDFVGKPDIENIDIGGSTLLRGAGKNGLHVPGVVDPNDYARVVDELIENGELSMGMKEDLAIKVFEATSTFDKHVYRWMKDKRQLGQPFLAPVKTAASVH